MKPLTPCQVVWFKKDLRVHDHEPVWRAAQESLVLGLFIYEPELYQAPEFDASHLHFLNESLSDLQAEWNQRGGSFILRHGSAVEVFESLRQEMTLGGLWSHEETGNWVTYQRDKAVAKWCLENRIPWHEYRQDGVIRRLKNRNGWATRWQKTMHLPILQPPPCFHSPKAISSVPLQTAPLLGLPPSQKPLAQPGGEKIALQVLESFLHRRGTHYRSSMSSPSSGWVHCSRISPYLTWGCLSLRTVVQATEQRYRALQNEKAGPETKAWLASLRSFSSRLRWHCHFMQKLEDEPRIEFENMARAFDGLRETFTDSAEGRLRLHSWQEGKTGYPMIDACMRSLLATGWINFRMRAMLVSFASHHLWLHWRPTAVFLARHFLDFEPGIHFSQFQMQSATTGINTVRIYSPAKQARDQDPLGRFIRLWVPELREVPEGWIAEPHKMPGDLQKKYGCILGTHYPEPIVDHATAYQEAREKIRSVRKLQTTREESRAIFIRHGSRKKAGQRKSPRQLELL